MSKESEVKRRKFTLINPNYHEAVREVTIEAEHVSDGYHTMHELYQHRRALNAALFNYMYMVDVSIRGEKPSYEKPIVVKSLLHNDGTMFEGDYFVVVANTPEGQISYHYQLKHWDDFRIPIAERVPWPYDGHTSEQCIERLLKL